jgi:hypothetical protein
MFDAGSHHRIKNFSLREESIRYRRGWKAKKTPPTAAAVEGVVC